MTDVQIEAGTLLANLEERTVTALLVPYGEVGRTNLGLFSIDKDRITIPRDPSVVMSNLDHKREFPTGPATLLSDTDAGVVATFKIADTDEGDTLLAMIEEKRQAGKPMAMSAEIRNIVLRAGKAVSGVLFGGAFVDQGAFPSASLLAADVGEEPVVTTSHSEDEFTDENGVTWTRKADSTTTTDSTSTTTETTVTEVTQAPEGDDKKEATVPNAVVNDTLEASAVKAPTPRTSLTEFAQALALAKGSKDNTLLAALAEPEGGTLFAALSDIQYDYAGSVGSNIIQPHYVGQLWSGRAKTRKVIPLLASAPLTSLSEVGWKWGTKPTMAKWAGNKANVPSNTPTTAPHTFKADRYAGAHDVAREFTDFGVTEFWTEYLQAMTDSYSLTTDSDALATLIAGATTVSAGSTTGFTDGFKATAAIIDAALATLDKDVPSYAIVGKDVYRRLLIQNTDNLIGTLSLALGLEDGSMESFTILPSSAAAIQGKVLVGAKAAAVAKELPGVPIRVEAQDLLRGGIDEGLFGYFGVDIVEPLGLSLVTMAA